jgi:hypothetical protein
MLGAALMFVFYRMSMVALLRCGILPIFHLYVYAARARHQGMHCTSMPANARVFHHVHRPF